MYPPVRFAANAVPADTGRAGRTAQLQASSPCSLRAPGFFTAAVPPRVPSDPADALPQASSPRHQRKMRVALSETPQPGAGGARPGGRRTACTGRALPPRYARIALITSGSSIHAMMRIVPPQSAQVSTSMPNTRFRRRAQRIATRRSAGARASAVADCALPLPRPALATSARCALFRANTPW